jgi:rod shape determining protein RodA
MRSKSIWRNFDYLLFGAVVFLSIFGIIVIRSAIAGNGELAGYPNRQAIYFGIGLIVLFGTALLDYHYWAALARYLYIIVLLFLIFTFITAQARFGAARWIETGFILIQPAEIAKLVMVIVLADYFARNHTSEKNFRWIAYSFAITGGMVIWILLQPNLSTSIVIFVIWFAMLWISGVPMKYLLILVAGAILLAVVIFPFLEPYQQGRILTFVFPDPNARYGNTYNVDQARITIGSGGLFGMGYGHGSQVQLRFLKVRHTDFIFAVMAEEFGYIGTVLIITLMCFVIWRCFRAARLSNDMFGSLLAYGFGILIFFQMAVNIGVNLNLIPVTGLTLPFISYGGSSLLSLLFGIGLVESVIARGKTQL